MVYVVRSGSYSEVSGVAFVYDISIFIHVVLLSIVVSYPAAPRERKRRSI